MRGPTRREVRRQRPARLGQEHGCVACVLFSFQMIPRWWWASLLRKGPPFSFHRPCRGLKTSFGLCWFFFLPTFVVTDCIAQCTMT